MRASSKYLVAVALLAVLAVVFGFAGMSAPVPQPAMPQQESSDSVTHFMNPPTFDSDWMNITDKCGQYFNVTHDLNTTEVFVDIVGKQSLSGTGGEHQRNLGGTGYTPGWRRTYGGTNYDVAYSMVQTVDGGYALAGVTGSYGAGSADFYLVKTDLAGSMQWSQTYGGTSDDYCRSVVQTVDGGYALAGYTKSFGAGIIDFWLVKTDYAGSMQWSQTYGGTSGDVAYDMVQTVDGGYALAGYTNSYGAGKADFWLVKTDSAGNMQWSQTYGGTSGDVAYHVVQTVDGGYAITGHTGSPGGPYDFWLVKTDSAGNMQWNQTYGGADNDAACYMVQTFDEGYAITGYTGPLGGPYDFWLVKTDSAGNMQWSQTYGGTSMDRAHSVVQTVDGGYALAGVTEWFMGFEYADFYWVKTDSAGNMQWSQHYGEMGSADVAYSVVQTSDGGYAVAGYTASFCAGSSDIWLIKTDVEMGLTRTGLTNSTITLYRGLTDPYWNYVRVRMWLIQEPTWQFGDINQDGVVDASDLFILSQNYGKTFSLLSLSGIVAVAGIHTYKKRKQPK